MSLPDVITSPSNLSASASIPSEVQFLKQRRTVHLYRDAPVPQLWVDEAVEAAHYAPNHRLTWPWRFTQIGPQTKARIHELALRMKKSSEPLTGDALEQFRQKRVYPQLMVVSQVRSDDQVRAREDYAAVACAIQNFTLALCARGVGSKWSTGRMTQHDLAYEVAQVDAEVEEIVGFLWYGFAARTPQVRRPDLSLVYRSTP